MNKISEKDVIAQKTQRRELKTLGSNIFYLEKRPEEKGRTTLLHNHREILPAEYDIKSKVHEYGGGSYAVSSKKIIFVNKKDQQLYLMDNEFKIIKLTNYEKLRFADGVIDEANHCSYWVCEDHRTKDVKNYLVRVSHQAGKGFGKITTLVQGEDFYAAPTLFKSQLAFISWSHPNMPWDETKLNLGQFKGEEFNYEVIDSGAWISQPRFNEEGLLHYLKEEGEFSNLFTFKDNQSICVFKAEREFASPGWNFGNKTYALYENKILATSWHNGVMSLELIDQGKSTQILTNYCGFSDLCISHDNLILECASFDKDVELVEVNLTTFQTKVLVAAKPVLHPVSIPQAITFPSTSGEAHGFLYLPLTKQTNLPLMVISHGGPTGMTYPFYNIAIQYWVDKGFAVFDVNYRGSTGYGKSYRNALKGTWGEIDVDDCVNAALYCVNKGIANKDQLIIRGGSAGGYTTMAALTFRDIFKAGASYYGVGDLTMLAATTHKFESRYLDSLIAPLSNQELYFNRSPNNFPDQIKCPVIVFQGEEDMVVPKSQAEAIYNNLVKKGIYSELYLFPEEGHGFSKEENLITCMVKEREFYQKVLKNK